MGKSLKVPLLDLKREYIFLKKDIDSQIKQCLASHSWILGEKVVCFEKEVADYLGAKYTIGVASGTDALLISLRALAIKRKNKEYFEKKDEIITTAFSFIATAEAIVRSGATPVFIDINPYTFNIDPAQIKKAISKNTVGILPVHLFGLACQMDEILKVARENNLFVVEDVAQAFGAEGLFQTTNYQLQTTKKLGTIGDCGAFSFFPSKNLGGYGDGGLIATNDEELAKLVTILRTHGQTKQYDASFIGYNSRLDTIQVAILLAKLKYIDKLNALRIKTAQKYNTALKNIEGVQIPNYPAMDGSASGGKLQILRQAQDIVRQAHDRSNDREQSRTASSKDTERSRSATNYINSHVYNLYTIKVNKNIRDKLLNFLNANGIQARIYYPLALHKMKAFTMAKVNGKLKNTEEATQSVLSLPIHPFLKNNEIQRIVDIIQSFTATLLSS